MIIFFDRVKADGQGDQRLIRGAGSAQQQAALFIEQLEVEIAFELVAVGGDLPILAGQVEAGVFLPLIGILRLPLLIDGAVGGQLPLLGHIAGQQLVGDARRLGEAGIKQLLHFVARLHVADKGADGETQTHQRQDTGE